MQQFVDVSMAAASIGMMMPGYTDRNRDYGVMFHGSFGCDGAWSWLATITNGDGADHRNVLDGETNDNFAYSARVNWDVIGHVGYEECALNRNTCEWRLAVGAMSLKEANDQTTILGLPTGSPVAAMAPGFALLATVGAYTAWRHWSAREGDDDSALALPGSDR